MLQWPALNLCYLFTAENAEIAEKTQEKKKLASTFSAISGFSAVNRPLTQRR